MQNTRDAYAAFARMYGRCPVCNNNLMTVYGHIDQIGCVCGFICDRGLGQSPSEESDMERDRRSAAPAPPASDMRAWADACRIYTREQSGIPLKPAVSPQLLGVITGALCMLSVIFLAWLFACIFF